jgi:hypothetical protein
MTIQARYEDVVFKPLEDVAIKDGTIVEVHLPPEAPAKTRPSIGDSPFAGIWLNARRYVLRSDVQ